MRLSIGSRHRSDRGRCTQSFTCPTVLRRLQHLCLLLARRPHRPIRRRPRRLPPNRTKALPKASKSTHSSSGGCVLLMMVTPATQQSTPPALSDYHRFQRYRGCRPSQILKCWRQSSVRASTWAHLIGTPLLTGMTVGTPARPCSSLHRPTRLCVRLSLQAEGSHTFLRIHTRNPRQLDPAATGRARRPTRSNHHRQLRPRTRCA